MSDRVDLDTSTMNVIDVGGVRTLVLNRPAKRNAVSQVMLVELTEAFDRAAANYCHNPCQSVADGGRQDMPPVSRSKENHWEPSESPSRRVGVTGIEPVTPSV